MPSLNFQRVTYSGPEFVETVILTFPKKVRMAGAGCTHCLKKDQSRRIDNVTGRDVDLLSESLLE